MAFPTLPTLPSLPDMVDPDRWVQRLDRQAFARCIGSNGCAEVDLEAYYIKQALAGKQAVLFVNAAQKCFDVWDGPQRIKQVPLKGLHGDPMPFERYVTLITQEARSEQRRAQASRRSFQ